MSNTSRPSRESDNGECCCIIRLFVCFFVVIVEVLLLNVGYTFTPWFFIWFLPLLFRPARGQVANDPATDVRYNERTLNSTTAAAFGVREDIEAPEAVSSLAEAQVMQVIPEDEYVDRLALRNIPEARLVARAVPVEKASSRREPPVARAAPTNGLQKQTSSAPKKVFSLLGPSGRKPWSSQFREAVTLARIETTEVDIAARKGVISCDNLDGTYDIKYERDGKVMDGTMQLEFKYGFCGWNIGGTRNDLTGNDGPFQIQRGFLARSGKIFWEERGEFEPRYSVLVVGQLDSDGGTSGTREGAFHGDWLSSKGMKTGRFLKFFRREDNESNVLSSSGEIV